MTPFELSSISNTKKTTNTIKNAGILARGGAKYGIYPENFGIGADIGYTNLLGLLPVPYADLDLGNSKYGIRAGIVSSPLSLGIPHPHLGFRFNKERHNGFQREFPRGLVEVIYDKLKNRTGEEAKRLQDEQKNKMKENNVEKKSSLVVEEGDPVSRVAASTLGRLNPSSLASLLLTANAYSDPSRNLRFGRDEKKIKEHKHTASLLEKYDPDALKNTLLRLGGTNIIDDIFYKKNRGENLPWYKRIGGRVWHNPKTSIFGKLLGTVGVPLQSITTPLFRSSNYNPFSDVATVYQNEPAIVEHELGHALDFNKLYGIRPGESKNKTFLNRISQELKGGLRDAYLSAYAYLPVTRLLHEAQANIESQKALNFSLKDDPDELKKRTLRRLQVLPAGYGSYVGGLIPVPFGDLIGAGTGKLVGLTSAELGRMLSKPADKKPTILSLPDKKENSSETLKAAQEGGMFMTPFELGRLTAQKQASEQPKNKTKSDAAVYKDMTSDVPTEFKSMRDEMYQFLKETAKRKKPAQKTAENKNHAAERGLWANIHAKRERGEAPAKPGDKDYPDQKSWNATVKASGDAWQRAEGKNPEGGLNAKGRASLKAEGQDIKPPVTEDKPTGERADRKASFCARMGGMKKKLTSSETANDPDSRINKALRKWNC